MLLDKTLDAVEAEGAYAAAAAMTGEEIAAAAVFHTAALLGRAPTSIAGSRMTVGNLAVTLSPDPAGKIRYRDIDRSFDIAGADVVQNDGPTTMCGLLKIMQFARDRTDALLYLPREMRRGRVNGIVEVSGAGERFVGSMMANYRRVAAELGG